jgi:protein-tyrosine-phosphatase
MAGAALSALGHEPVVTAGTLTIPGQPMSHRTRKAMEAHGLAAPTHRSAQAYEHDLAAADLVIGLAGEHVEWVRREHPAHAGKAITLRRLVRDRPAAPFDGLPVEPWEDVEDPGGGELPDFERACAEIVPLVEALHGILTDRQISFDVDGPS